MEQQHLQRDEIRTPTEARIESRAEEASAQSAAESALLGSDSEQVEELVATLNQEMQTQRKSLLFGLPGLLVVTAIAGALTSWMQRFLHEDQWLIPAMIFLGSFCGASARFLYGSLKPRRRRRQLAKKIARLEDIRAVGPLINSLGCEDGIMHYIAIEGLIRLLPLLKASDAERITPQQRTILCQVLAQPADIPMLNTYGYIFRRPDENDIRIRVAILKAFEQIGDQKVLPFVEALANGSARTAGQKQIKQAAEECLPALHLRVSQMQSSQTLLRASQAADASPETLLRAAVGSETAPDQLLRPGSSAP